MSFCEAEGINRTRTELASLLSSSLTNSTSAYTVQPGSYSFFFLKDCDTYNLDSCFALNADSPYGMTLVPDGPEQPAYTDCETLTGVCGIGCPPGDPKICIEEKPMKHLLGKDEAIVILMETPPPCQYWSMTYYQMSTSYNSEAELRTTEPNGFSSVLQEAVSLCPSGEDVYPGRCKTFASLGAPVNYRDVAIEKNKLSKNVTLIDEGPVENFKDGFNQPIAFVMTGSKKLYQNIEKELQSLCGTSLPTFLAPLPTDLLTMGSSGDSVNDKDVFTMLLRTAFPDNMTDMIEFFDQTPVSVMRVSSQQADTSPVDSCEEYYCRRDNTFKTRGHDAMESGGTEFTSDELKAGLEYLGAVINKQHKKGKVQTSPFVKPYFDTGFDCIDQGTMCNGDCPDTLYPIAENVYNAELCKALNPIILPLGSIGAVALAFFVFWAAVLCFRPPREILCLCRSSPKTSTTHNEGQNEQLEPEEGPTNNNGKTDEVGTGEGEKAIETDQKEQPETKINDEKTFRSWTISSPLRFYVVTLSLAWCGFWIVFGPTLHVFLTRLQCDNYATLYEDPDDFYVVYGINHATTGASTYSSVNAYHYETLSGVGAASSVSGYEGSAQVYLGDDSKIAKYLYAYRFARDCKVSGFDSYCLDIASEGEVSIPLDHRIMFIGRMYIDPKTGAGPDPNEVIYDYVKHFY